MTPTVVDLVFIALAWAFQISESQTKVAVTGCVAEGKEPNTFILSGAKKNPEDSSEVAVDYRLVPVPGLKLEDRLGLVVRASGYLAGESDATGKDEAAKDLPKLVAERVKQEGECPEASESDDDAETSGGSIGFGDLRANGMGGFDFGSTFAPAPGRSNAAAQSWRDLGLFGSADAFGTAALMLGAAPSGSMGLSGSSEPSGFSDGSGSSVGFGSAGSGGSMLQSASGIPANVVAQTTAPLGVPPAPSGLNTSAVGPAIAVAGATAALGLSNSTATSASLGWNISSTTITNPEPATLVLLGTGLGLCAFLARRRTRLIPR